MAGEQKYNTLSVRDSSDHSRARTPAAGNVIMREMLAYLNGDTQKSEAEITTLWK